MISNARFLEGSSPQTDAFSAVVSPIQLFFFFHKAIRVALERLCSDALAAENGGNYELQFLLCRFELFRLVYAQHSNAEDEVLLPALDTRVKNIASTYSLEHREEEDLLDSMSKLMSSAQAENSPIFSKRLKSEFRCYATAIQTSFCKHMSKEEAQVFPLLLKHFNVKEQAALVWQCLCRIPVNLLQNLLPWIAASLSEMEHESMVSCMRAVIHKDDLMPHVVLTWLSSASTYERHDVDIMEIICNRHLIERDQSAFRKGKGSAHNMDSDVVGFEGCSRPPVSDLIFWHTSMEKECINFAEYAKALQVSELDYVHKLSYISKRLKFLMEIRTFYSAAEDNILFPAIFQRASHAPSFVTEHIQEELEIRKLASFLEGLHAPDTMIVEGTVDALCNQAFCIAKDVENHLKDEAPVFSIVLKYFNAPEQQALFYDCLCMLSLKILAKTLPWLASLLDDQTLNYMLQNLKQGGPANNDAFARLLIEWATGRNIENLAEDKIPCPSILDEEEVCGMFAGNWGTISAHNHFYATSDEPLHADVALSPDNKENSIGTSAECLQLQSSCSVPSCSSSYDGSFLFGVDCMANSKNKGEAFKPIDCIFQFHKAIRRDLEYLDQESARISDCDDEFLRQFTGRFMMLWSMYHAHSNAENDVVFPALEARKTLYNISHSYVIDHEKEEQLFKDISNALTQLSELHAYPLGQQAHVLSHGGNIDKGQSYSSEWKETLTQLQGLCKSLQISLNQHISREERELWPLLRTYFSIQEQENVVGRVIGITGAKLLQSMIPWVTEALSLEEQRNMFDVWLLVTRNTMFDQWLCALFPRFPIQLHRIVTPSTEQSQQFPVLQDDLPRNGNSEWLRILAEYLANDSFSDGSAGMHDENMESKMEIAGVSCELCFQGAKKVQRTESEHSCELSTCHETDGVDKNYNCVPEKMDVKDGWLDIFRMNQKNLEAAIRKVSNDGSLDPQQKAYLMQNLMTSRWTVAQQRQISLHEDGKDVPGCSASFHDQEMKIFGCEHYRRNCKLLASCCQLLFTCRFCHDNVSDHTMDRQATKEMMCMGCLKIQPVAQHCCTPSCNNFLMARYYCSICKFFDDDIKDIYHCPYCNICRVGKGLGIDYFHCMICNACMNVSLKTHKCREKGLESNCPICHDFMFTSKAPVKALSCGHFMHSACFQAFTNHHYTCPICCKSVGDMSAFFGRIDGLLAGEELPEVYKNRKQEILCHDCEQKSLAPFHWRYHKCAKCGSYNTRVL